MKLGLDFPFSSSRLQNEVVSHPGLKASSTPLKLESTFSDLIFEKPNSLLGVKYRFMICILHSPPLKLLCWPQPFLKQPRKLNTKHWTTGRVRVKPTKTRKLRVKPPVLPLIHLAVFSCCSVPKFLHSPATPRVQQDKANSRVYAQLTFFLSIQPWCENRSWTGLELHKASHI